MNDPINSSVSWITGIFTGPLVTTVGIIAVVMIGIAALSGHLNKFQLLRVVLGLFIVFGAPQIARELIKFGEDRKAQMASDQRALPNEASEIANGICWTCN
jgi:type IV secretion system protein VirB2